MSVLPLPVRMEVLAWTALIPTHATVRMDTKDPTVARVYWKNFKLLKQIYENVLMEFSHFLFSDSVS